MSGPVVNFPKYFGRGERIRTSDLTVPNRALYQAEPRPDEVLLLAAVFEDAVPGVAVLFNMRTSRICKLSNAKRQVG